MAQLVNQQQKKTKANIGDARHMKSLGWEDPLQKEMATCSSVLAWKIPSTEEPGELQSMRSQSQTWMSACVYTHTQPY